MSFRLKTVLGIACIEFFLLAILLFNGFRYLTLSSEAELSRTALLSAKLLATMTTEAVVANDLAGLKSIIDATLDNKALEYIRVRSASGNVLAQGGNPSALAAKFTVDTSINDTEDDNRFDVGQEISVAGRKFGVIELGISTSLLKSTISDAINWGFSIAATEMALVALFGIALGTILTRQIEKLRDGARLVSEGNFGHQIAVKGSDEIAAATRSFNSMSSALAEFARSAEAARLQAEKGRDYAQSVLRDAMNSMPLGIAIIDKNADVDFINYAYKKMHPDLSGVSLEERQKVTLDDFCALTLSNVVRDQTLNTDALISLRKQRLSSQLSQDVLEDVTVDGRTLITMHSPMSEGGIVIVETDITDLKKINQRSLRLEMEILNQHKMESLGTLAGGIAHEINTPIQYIGDNISFLKESFLEISSVLEAISIKKEFDFQIVEKLLKDIEWNYLAAEIPTAIAQTEDGVSAISGIVRSINQYAHPDSERFSLSDVSKIIENAVTISRNQWKYAAEVEFDFGNEVPEVPCSASEISQVFINLLGNAAQAIQEKKGNHEKGKIRISTRMLGKEVEIRVSDNGPGVPTELAEKIFDLFFTTKAPGLGTGQGLAISKMIVEQKHKGKLFVESNASSGATFVMRLPYDANGSSDRSESNA